MKIDWGGRSGGSFFWRVTIYYQEVRSGLLLIVNLVMGKGIVKFKFLSTLSIFSKSQQKLQIG